MLPANNATAPMTQAARHESAPRHRRAVRAAKPSVSALKNALARRAPSCSGDWGIPVNAGQPFMEKPPLYAWVAAGFARLFSPWLPLHDGARLASAFFSALTLGFAARTARLCL